MMKPEYLFSKLAGLNKKERRMVEDFAKNPRVSRLLLICEILKRKQYDQEVYELLSWGIKRFPDYLAARVSLSSMLYEKGLIQDAWDCLGPEGAFDLSGNYLGLKLKLRLSVLLGFEGGASRALSQLEACGVRDGETSEIGKILHSGGLRAASALLIGEFRKNNQEVFLPASPSASAKGGLQNPDDLSQKPHPSFQDSGGIAEILANFAEDPGMKGFYVVPLSEVFSVENSAREDTAPDSPLDSPTIAEIYYNQGLYQKALKVYKNLLTTSPGNEAWKARIREIKGILEEAEQQDLSLDPSLIRKWDTINGIRKKTRFYQELLEQLHHCDRT